MEAACASGKCFQIWAFRVVVRIKHFLIRTAIVEGVAGVEKRRLRGGRAVVIGGS